MTSETTANGSVTDHPPISSEMVQVINYEEHFNEDLNTFLTEQRIAQLGFDYHVAAIMGPQSSGKSTLLNMLFGTTFRTMDETSGRYQVTQGVWLGRDAEAGIIVMDLEGTDSRERGEDAATYERKSSLFALALAEVLIVNVWAQDVGRYNAANMSLLKTVMELDLQLFFGGATAVESTGEAEERVQENGKPRMHKTRLLFVLRDHVSSPFETLCNTLRADVDNIWNTITKPAAAENTAVTDYFDLDFFALPHKVLMEDMFYKKGAELRRRFHENEVFLEEYSRGVAADGFAAYAENVWETIRANRELDIPTQKEMLAHVRCEQIARDAVVELEKTIEPLRTKLVPGTGGPGQMADGLFPTLLNAANDAVDAYESCAYRYSAVVADLKGADMKAKVSGDCKMLYDVQVALASDMAIKEFREKVASGPAAMRKKGGAPWEKWGSVSKDAMDSSLELFDKACASKEVSESAEKLSDDHPLSFSVSTLTTARRRVSMTLNTELERATRDVMSAGRSEIIKTFRDGFKGPLNTVLESASTEVWERTSEVSAAAWETTAREARRVFGDSGLGLAAEQMEEVIEDEIKPACYERALTDIKDAVGTPSNFLMRMTKRFDDAFRFDDRGVPRHFGPNEDLEALFVTAREKGEELVDLLGEVQLTGPLTLLRTSARSLDDAVTERMILPPHVRDDLRAQLKRQAGATFMEAKRAQEAAKITTKVPIWLLGVMVILGWNELLAVLRNPVLLLLTVLVVPAVYVGYTLDAPTLLGPAVRATVTPMLEQAKVMLDQVTEQTREIGGPASRSGSMASVSTASAPASAAASVPASSMAASGSTTEISESGVSE